MALDPTALQAAVRAAVDVSWASLVPDSDQIGITDPARYPLQRLFCQQVAAAYDGWMQAATLQAGDLVATTPGPATLAIALRTPQFQRWSASFTSYILAIVWHPGTGSTLISGGGSSANIAVKAASLQAGLDALVSFGPGQFSHRREFADKIAGLLATYTVGTTITSVVKQPPPPTIEALIS